MCGIIGCKLKRPLNPDDIELMRAMRDQMAHRGPDGAGEYISGDDGLYLGHRRLSIIDPEPRSAQPYVNNKTVITYNGEIYNYIELRKELSSHTSFETSSDTEVLLKAWQHWGASCLGKLDGMYAFAISDDSGLHLVTDVFGEKPLYIYENEDGFYFASEAQALIKYLDIKWEPSQAAINDFINLGYIRSPYTGYKNLEYVPPATHIIIEPNGNRKDHAYWSPEKPVIGSGEIRTFEQSQIDDIRDLLCESLDMRLRSDVPVGLFLSGGVDSSLVAALATNELGVELQSYTVSFAGTNTDESEYAANIARHLGMSHTIIPSNTDRSSTPKDVFQSLIDIYGVPNDNMTALAVNKMCESAKEHLTVALSGLGGDELFLGYNKYEHLYKNRALYSISPYLQMFLPLIGKLPISKIKTAAKMLSGDSVSQYLEAKNGAAQEAIIAMGRDKIDDFDINHDTPSYMQAREIDLLYSMPQSHIPAIDRGSMRQSIEVRTPFLNRKLLTYVMGLDQRALIHFGKKNLLQELLKRYMPLDILTPKKQGFVYPIPNDPNKGDLTMPPWAEGADSDILKNANANKSGYERLALRLSILSKMDNSSSTL